MDAHYLYDKLEASANRNDKAINATSLLKFGEVIDPKDTWISIVSAWESCSIEEVENSK